MKNPISRNVMMVLVVTATVLVDIAFVASALGAEPPASARVDYPYRSILSECSRGKSPKAQLLKVFGGFFPIPTNFVIVDAAHDQLEYSDLAYPWSKPKAASTVFYAPKNRFDERWGWLSSLPSAPAGKKCAVVAHRYENVEQFGASAVVVTDGSEYLLFIGPVADATSEALACYDVTRSQQCTRER